MCICVCVTDENQPRGNQFWWDWVAYILNSRFVFLLYHLISSKHASRCNLTVVIGSASLLQVKCCCWYVEQFQAKCKNENEAKALWDSSTGIECICVCVCVNEKKALLKWAKCESQLKVITLVLVIYKIISKSLKSDCIQCVCVLFLSHFNHHLCNPVSVEAKNTFKTMANGNNIFQWRPMRIYGVYDKMISCLASSKTVSIA